ncbi:putative nuclease HARBI1 [Dreissena polymorpha]|uniref:putative nuclease HARBI1 n=1 Tax=Dreissena polymorpha TaxID=45954 RepID=UPI0022655A4D|nr:putative nuclease HARBI1 [Dreissena polymorpha]
MAAAHRNLRRCRNNRRLRVERVFLDRTNPLEIYRDVELYKRFRFTRDTLQFICEICFDVERHTNRSLPIPVALSVCTYLRYVASGDLQLTVADSTGLSQATVCRVCAQVSAILAAKVSDFVKFPTGIDAARVKQGLGAIAGFPNALGCIDCTHINIKKPNENVEDFIGRKGIPTINVQAICDADYKITSFTANWPGRTHDARIWRNCELRNQFENGQHAGLLIGDSGYGCSRYLLTPYLRPVNQSEDRFNRSLCRTRVMIEQTFGMLKNRFGILGRKIRATPTRAVQHISACIFLRLRIL